MSDDTDKTAAGNPQVDGGWGFDRLSVVLAERVVLDSVTMAVRPGEVVAVVGGDGAGKTTLLRTLCGRVIPATGRVRAPDRLRIGYQPAASGTWANLTVLENLQVVARAHHLDPVRLRRRREELLIAAGLWDARDRLASQLSGGMRQKLGFCMAILHEPALLILDEPTTGVDPVSRVELWALIAGAAAGGAAVVMATTYLDEAERAQQVLVLDHGVPLLHGTPQQVLTGSPGTITRVPFATEPNVAWRRGHEIRQWHPGPPEPDDTVVPTDMEDAVIAAALQHHGRDGSDHGDSADVAPSAPAATTHATPRTRPSASGFLVEAAGLTCTFGTTVAVREVSMQVAGGEIVGLIGANGAGKTTLIRALLGLIAPSTGAVGLFGAAPSRHSRSRVGYVPQGLGLYRDLTAAENLAFVSAAYDRPIRHHDGALADIPDDLVGEIGLGRQRRLAFACALDHHPELLVLDEPTSGVDPVARARLWDTIHSQADSGTGVLVSTHYMQEAEQCDRLIVMDLGRVVAEGTSREIIGDTAVARVRSRDWAASFQALRAAHLPVALAGTEVRVVDTAPDTVLAALRDANVAGEVDSVPATLEEKMIAIARGRALTDNVPSR